jgi:hypothetical protein
VPSSQFDTSEVTNIIQNQAKEQDNEQRKQAKFQAILTEVIKQDI